MFKKIIKPMSQLLSKDNSILFSLIKEGWESVKNIVGILKKVGNSKQTNIDSCEINDLSEINNIFNEFIYSIEPKVNEIEESIQYEMCYYLDELMEFFYYNNDELKEKGIRINIIEKKIEKIKHSINGKLKKEISKNISIDNYEFKQIINMVPGERKTNRLNKLFDSTLNKAIENLIIDIKESMENLMDDIEFYILDNLEILNKCIQNQIIVLEQISSDEFKKLEKKELIIEKSILNILISESVIEMLK